MENLVQKLSLQDHARLVQRVLLRFEFHVPHQILYTILATDEKYRLGHFHIFYQTLKSATEKCKLCAFKVIPG